MAEGRGGEKQRGNWQGNKCLKEAAAVANGDKIKAETGRTTTMD
jgi:hypothetical protein